MRRDRDAEGRKREEGLGLRPYGSGARNGFSAYLRSERSHLKHHFEFFWAMEPPPKRRGARENFPISLPLDVHLLLTSRLFGKRRRQTPGGVRQTYVTYKHSKHCSGNSETANGGIYNLFSAQAAFTVAVDLCLRTSP